MKSKIKENSNKETTKLPEEIEASIKALEEKLNSEFPMGIPRRLIGKATGSILHPRTCANNDCSQEGIPGRFKIGRNTVYPVQGVIDFIKSKMTTVA